jgi:hypothetical protein
MTHPVYRGTNGTTTALARVADRLNFTQRRLGRPRRSLLESRSAAVRVDERRTADADRCTLPRATASMTLLTPCVGRSEAMRPATRPPDRHDHAHPRRQSRHSPDDILCAIGDAIHEGERAPERDGEECRTDGNQEETNQRTGTFSHQRDGAARWLSLASDEYSLTPGRASVRLSPESPSSGTSS